MKELNLLLHCGAHPTDRQEVFDSPTPQGTLTWTPIPHKAMIDLVESKLPNYGLSIVKEQHALMRNGSRYFGLFQVINGSPDDDYGLVIGIRNSHDKSFPAGLCLGSGVFVCDNLAFSAEVVVGRRHTRYIMSDLPRLIGNALGKLVQARHDQQHRINVYKSTGITDERAANLLFKAFEHKAITKTKLGEAWKQWKTPNHKEFAEEKTLWRLFNGVTEVQKGTNPFELSARTQRLHGLMDAEAGLQVLAS